MAIERGYEKIVAILHEFGVGVEPVQRLHPQPSRT
jgi:hypothetical protein